MISDAFIKSATQLIKFVRNDLIIDLCILYISEAI